MAGAGASRPVPDPRALLAEPERNRHSGRVDEKLVIESHVRVAQDAFWAVVAQRFPEVATGDLPPDAEVAFDEACHRVVWTWLGANTGSLQ